MSVGMTAPTGSHSLGACFAFLTRMRRHCPGNLRGFGAIAAGHSVFFRVALLLKQRGRTRRASGPPRAIAGLKKRGGKTAWFLGGAGCVFCPPLVDTACQGGRWRQNVEDVLDAKNDVK